MPFFALYPAFIKFFSDFFPRACFLRETMRPLRVFIKSFFFKPPEVCLAVPWNTCALVPTAGTLLALRVVLPLRLPPYMGLFPEASVPFISNICLLFFGVHNNKKKILRSMVWSRWGSNPRLWRLSTFDAKFIELFYKHHALPTELLDLWVQRDL